MQSSDLLLDHAERIAELYGHQLDGLDHATAHHRVQGVGNPVVWLLWHTARVQDDHVAALAGVPQAWDTWAPRFALPLEHEDIGYGHLDRDVDLVRVQDLGLLAGYHADVHRLTGDYVRTVDAEELDRLVDDAWDPPVTAGVRLVSVVGDCLQHLGQAAFVRGLLAT